MALDRFLTRVHVGWLEKTSLLFYLCATLMIASLLLGGATRGGFLSDNIVQLIALPLLAITLWKLLDTPLTEQVRFVLIFCLAIVAVPFFQLIPLPPWLWTIFSARGQSAAVFEAMGQTVPWMPVSVSPSLTWVSGLALIPPLAIFLATLLLTYRERRWLSLIVIAIGTLSVFIGLVQVAQGPGSSWRFFEITNPTEAVGFFANRNHFAALGYCLILFTAAWATNVAIETGKAKSLGHLDAPSIIAAIGCFCLLIVLLAGEAMARSRAGLGLTIVALFGAFALGISDRRVGSGSSSNRFLIGAVALSVILIIQYALYRILERFEVDPLDDARTSFIPSTIEAAISYLPLGSGLGTFVPVYGSVEKPENALLNIYANHAHNDFVEIFLETGLFGLALVAIFVWWLAKRIMAIWQNTPALGANEIDWSLARASALIIVLLLIHSLVDYPLRTAAMMAVFAFSCALLIEPLVATEPILEVRRTAKKAHHRRSPGLAPVPAFAAPSLNAGTTETAEQPKRGERWGTDMQWPDEWRKDP